MAAPGYVLKNKRTTLERAEKFISTSEWTDCNLYSRLFKHQQPIKDITHYAAPGRITYAEALTGLQNEGKPAQVGQSFGPTWSTHWFRISLDIPSAWKGEKVLFVWESGSEAMIWIDGKPRQGFTSEDRTEYVLTDSFSGSENGMKVFVEMACNGLFGAGKNDQIQPPDSNKYFVLKTVDLVVKDHNIQQLITDFEIVIGLAKHLPEENQRSYQALYTANEMVNTIVLDDRSTYHKAMDIAKRFFKEKNGESQHKIVAVGNCHIDSAWLWTYAETIRKCGRSWSSTLRLMEKYPHFTFACSQAQQFEWMKIHYPALYEEMKLAIKGGRFIPVGSVWVEMDGLVPSGEAMLRQFLYGQKYFEKEFGIRCKEFWLPDTFGYSGQLPQIVQHSGLERFVTQKISWNLVNKFPHNTFWWYGIDGSRVLTHFPPADSYGNSCTVKEVLFSAKNFQDKGRSNTSLFLYGYGDGGQGPTSEMLDRLQRMENVDGCPKVELSTPDHFFTEVEHHDVDNLCHWVGELYLELHNATYTTQAKTKKNNRLCEFLLHNVEAVSSIASILCAKFSYPAEELLRVWKLLLLNQFHDVLPGSSIHDVYKDALAYYKDVKKSGSKMFQEACKALLNSNVSEVTQDIALFNTQSWDRQEVVSLPPHTDIKSPAKKRQKTDPMVQIDYSGNTLVLASAPSYGYSSFAPQDVIVPVTAKKTVDDLICLSSAHLEVVLDSCGRVVSLCKPGSSRNAVGDGELGNQLVLFNDVPLYWDAWDVMDYHLETRKPLETSIQQAMIIEEGPLRATVLVSVKISDMSYMKQYITLDATSPYLAFRSEVEWHESHKFLKVEFPVNVHAQLATYEIQFGHIQRPTHLNTSWDWAKFEVGYNDLLNSENLKEAIAQLCHDIEVCGHKWADVSEFDFGVSVLNDSKYGWSCIGNILRLSLLRSSKSPDEKADMGVQTFTYAVMPHTGTFQSAGVVQAAYNLNNPLQVVQTDLPESLPLSASYFTVDQPAVILENVKKAEDEQHALVLRLYEAYGGRATATVTTTLPVKEIHVCNGIEDIDHEKTIDVHSGAFKLDFNPFQIRSVMLHF